MAPGIVDILSAACRGNQVIGHLLTRRWRGESEEFAICCGRVLLSTWTRA